MLTELPLVALSPRCSFEPRALPPLDMGHIGGGGGMLLAVVTHHLVINSAIVDCFYVLSTIGTRA
jgi:hypothetical protein